MKILCIKKNIYLCNNFNAPKCWVLSRHTFATLTLSKGVSIESVSKMLGHTNIQTTQIYVRITDDKISWDMVVFSEKIKDIGVKLQENDDNLKLAVNF